MLSNLDLMSVIQFFASKVVDPTVASIIGPYSVIILASIGGVAASLANDKTQVFTRWNAFLFFFRGLLVSLLWTVPLATSVAFYFGEGWQAQWFFLPVAAGLSYASGKWKQILEFFVGLGKQFIINWVKSKAPPPNESP